MHRKTVWIEISREWIEFGVAVRGQVGSVHRVLFDPNEGGGRAHDDALGLPSGLKHHVAHGLSMLGATRAGADVLWHANGPCVDVHTVAAPPAAAEGAATLAFSMANAADQSAWSTSARVVSSRKSDDDSYETNVLVSGVRHDVLRVIEQSIEEAGCTLRTVVPTASIGVLLSVEGAIDASRQAPGHPAICLHVGEDVTAIAIAQSGALLVARTIEMGYATLRDAYLRAARGEHPSHAEAFLAAHRRLLEIDGIPSPKSDQTRAIFDSVRPFLQRLFIEIKQTVRFTLEEGNLQRTHVRLAGPGATIPRLAEMLAEEVGFEMIESPPPRPDAAAPGFGIADALRTGAAGLGVQPPGRVEKRERSSRRAALLYGAVGAALLLAGFAYVSLSRASSFEARARQLDRELEAWRTEERAGQGVNPRALSSAMETLIQSECGLRADWGAALAEIAGSRPEGVRFTGVSGDRDRDGSHLRIEGVAPADVPDRDPHKTIADFVEALQASPLVKESRLGATEQFDTGEQRFLRFGLTIDVVETPAGWLVAERGR